MINLNKIKNWEELKKSSRWVNLNFQSHSNNREAKYFSYNFETKNAGDVLSFLLKLVDNNNKDIEFESGDKKISNHKLFNRNFSMNKKTTKDKRRAHRRGDYRAEKRCF